DLDAELVTHQIDLPEPPKGPPGPFGFVWQIPVCATGTPTRAVRETLLTDQDRPGVLRAFATRLGVGFTSAATGKSGDLDVAQQASGSSGRSIRRRHGHLHGRLQATARADQAPARTRPLTGRGERDALPDIQLGRQLPVPDLQERERPAPQISRATSRSSAT